MEEVVGSGDHRNGQIAWLSKGEHVGQRDSGVATAVYQEASTRDGLWLVVPVTFDLPRGDGYQDQLLGRPAAASQMLGHAGLHEGAERWSEAATVTSGDGSAKVRGPLRGGMVIPACKSVLSSTK
jgi:hypothetical protein